MTRPTSSQRGYDARWRKRREWFLKRHPLCEEGCGNWATEVDHRTAKAAGGTDHEHNLRGLCKQCHSRKTVRRDGGLGRQKVSGPEVRIVCGPDPAARADWIRQHARPDDAILPPFDEPLEAGELVALIERARNQDTQHCVWVGGLLPDARQRTQLAAELGAQVTVLELRPEHCADPLRARDWWDLYRRRGGERITTW